MVHWVFPGSPVCGDPQWGWEGDSGFYPVCYNTSLRFCSPELVDQRTACLVREGYCYMKQAMESCAGKGPGSCSLRPLACTLTHRLSPPNTQGYSVPANCLVTARDVRCRAVALIQAQSRLLGAVAVCPLGSLPHPSPPTAPRAHCQG